jgi:hypothetical protein
MQPSRLKLIKIKPHCCESHENYFSTLYSSTLIQKFEIPRLLSQATASNHLFICPYQKDERAKPGNLLTNRCSFSPGNTVPITSPMNFHIHLLFCYTFYLSFSPCSLVDGCRRFGETLFPPSSTLKMQTASSFRTSHICSKLI